jgi:phage recombination protein Bet
MGSQVTVAAREEFSPAQIKLLRRTVAKDCNDEEFSYFLEVAAAYDLNPLVGEVYASKMGGSNGSGGRVVILVGRNGWLKMARRNANYLGIDGDVVRENDSFKVSRKADGTREILHEYEGDADKRGAIKGAWAEVITTAARYYVFAPIAEYRPTNQRKLEYSPWGSQESVMIQKCAYIAALRIAFSISGVYDEAEMDRMRAQTAARGDARPSSIEWGEDPTWPSG